MNNYKITFKYKKECRPKEIKRHPFFDVTLEHTTIIATIK